MADLEKVIKGLECCLTDDEGYYLCEKCPYAATDEDRTHVDWSCHKTELGMDALELLKAQDVPETNNNGWISVKDRLPEENVAVNIVWLNTDPERYYEHIKNEPFTATGVYFHGEWYWWSSVVQDYLAEYGVGYTDKMDKAITVTHWMPLPEPPKEGLDDHK